MRRRTWWVEAAAILIAAAFSIGSTGVGGSGAVRATKKADYYTFPYSGDNTGIQEACNYAGPGGKVQIGVGRFAITSTLNTPTGITLEGMGDSTVLYLAANDTMFNVWGANVTLKNMRLEGMKATRTQGQAVFVTGDSARVEGLTITDFYDMGVHIHMGADAAVVQNCRVRATGGGSTPDGNGIVIHDSNDSKVLNNWVTGSKKWGVWIQNVSKRAVVMGNTVQSSGNDGIRTDLGTWFANIVGNTVESAGANGINVAGDSTSVSSNVVTKSGEFGIWAQNGGSGGSWWGNLCASNYLYNMGIEASAGDTIAGWAIFSNFLINPGGQDFEIQSTGGGAFVRDVQFANNYIIKSAIFAGTVPHPAIKIIANSGGAVERVSYIGNVVKDSKRDGFWFDVSGTGWARDIVVTGNHVEGSTYWGLRTTGGGLGSNVFLSDNYYRGNGSGAESLSTASWTYEAIGGKSRHRGTSVVYEDSARIGTPSGSPAPLTVTGDIVGFQDLKLNNKMDLQWKDVGGTYQRYVAVDSVNNLQLRARTGANIDWFKSDGFVGCRFIGTGGLFMPSNTGDIWMGTKFLSDDGTNRRIIGRYGQIAFRDSANGQNNLTISNAGNVDLPQSSASLSLGGQVALKKATSDLQIRPLGSGQKIIVRDWADANDNAYLYDTGAFEVLRGTTYLDKNAIIADSARIIGNRLQIGGHATSVANDTLVLGRGTLFRKYGTAGDFLIQSSGNIYEMTFAGINAFRASDAAGSIRFQTGGTTSRVQIESDGTLYPQNMFRQKANLISSASTITLNSTVQKISGTTTITDINSINEGIVVYLVCTTAVTIQSGNHIKINGNFVANGTGNPDILTLYSDGTDLIEVGRSIQ